MKHSEISIRPALESDYSFILSLNEKNVEVLSPLYLEGLRSFANTAALLWLVECNSKPAGFLIALREGIDNYTSENYRWFCRNYDRFLYIDRIVIDAPFRHCGIGKALYKSVFDTAVHDNVPRVTAEIDTIPYNAESLAFHRKLGFHEVGTQYIRDNTVCVSLQVVEIVS